MQHLAAPVLSLLLIATLAVGCQAGSTVPPPRKDLAEDPVEVQTDAFGLQADRYTVTTGRVDRGETFSDLVDAHGVDYQTILALSKAAEPGFSVEDLQAGQPYRVYVNPWLQRAQYLVYQISPVRYVVFDVRRPERTRIETRPAEHRWATVSGTVDGSLYQSLVDEGGHPLLALRLSEVFAWQIDFFRLRSGDRFRILYEKRFIAGEEVQPGGIVAAYVRHRGEDFYAFRFRGSDTEAEYFTRDGQSLRRQLLKAPLQYSRISSGYTNRRYHPVLKEYRPHRAIDYAAPRGTPVRSVGSGTVQFAGYDGPNGNYVKIRHNGTYTSGYLHLSNVVVAPGESVKQGETIGHVGSTGRSTGPHLDYRLWKHGTAVNPYTLDLPPSQPVPLSHREAFRKTVDALLPMLRGPAKRTYARAWSGEKKPSTGRTDTPVVARSSR